MTEATALVVRARADALTPLDARGWRQALLAQHAAGARLVTLFGRRAGDAVILTAVHHEPSGALTLLRGELPATAHLHAVTPELPAAHPFEREVHEQTGLRVTGHPWLKPIRFQGQTSAAMDRYPFYAIEGKEVHEVAVGPIHAGVIEPGAFRFMCFGEQVHHLEIHLGYQHRGVEARLLAGDPRRLGPLVETIAGDTSVAHAWAYAAAVEALADHAPRADVEDARAVALELERVAMHLAGLTGLAADVGFLQGATTYGRLRTTAINSSMKLCGSRFGRSAVRPGGQGLRLDAALRRELVANVALLRDDLDIIDDRFRSARTVRHRMEGVGVLTAAQAREVGVVGMTARASGVPLDTRAEPARGAFGAHPLPMQLVDSGDCWARAELRMREMDASLRWLDAALARHEAWSVSGGALGALAPRTVVASVVEGWRGEVVHVLETDEAGRLLHYKAQDPSLRNWMGLALAVRTNEISDFPICNKSFDLSYCGNDL